MFILLCDKLFFYLLIYWRWTEGPTGQAPIWEGMGDFRISENTSSTSFLTN
jgi:hypothetical protein